MAPDSLAMACVPAGKTAKFDDYGNQTMTDRPTRHLPTALLALLSSFVLGCGGGGGGGGGGVAPPPVQSNNADLRALVLTLAPLDQAFQANQLNYTAATGFLGAGTWVGATTDDANATMTINGVPTISGMPSALIALDEGDTDIVIEVTAENGVSLKVYIVTVSRETAANFAQHAYAKASNTDAGDQFGHGIAVWGDTMAVGAVNEASDATGINGPDNNNNASAGAVYVFVRDLAGIWAQQAYVKASNTDAGDRFGDSVALFDDTLVVGAPGEASLDQANPGDNSGNNVGAVYAYTRDAADVWTQQAYLKASNPDTGDVFGRVALFADTLVVGAAGEDGDVNGPNNNLLDAGAAYVFERNAGNWGAPIYLKASNAGSGDLFSRVSISGDAIGVGAAGEGGDANSTANAPNDNLSNAGAAYVFERAGANWTQIAYLKAFNADTDDAFSRVGISGETLVVGAPGEDSDGLGDNNNFLNSGAAYVYERGAGGNWTGIEFLKASNVDPGDEFGSGVAISSGALVVGARSEQSSALGIGGNQLDNSLAAAGAGYAFVRNAAGNWNQVVYIKPSNTRSNYRFGDDVALDRETLGISAVFEAGGTSGIDGNQNDTSQAAAGAGYFFD